MTEFAPPPPESQSPVHTNDTARPFPSATQPGSDPATTKHSRTTSLHSENSLQAAATMSGAQTSRVHYPVREAHSNQHPTDTGASPQLQSPSSESNPHMPSSDALPSNCYPPQIASAASPPFESPNGPICDRSAGQSAGQAAEQSAEQSAEREGASTRGRQAQQGDESLEGDDSDTSDGGEASREDMNAWLYDVLQRVQPGASITVNSLQLLESLFDTLVGRVLSEAQACAEEPAVAGQTSGRKRKPEILTSLQIQKAMRRVLPGEPGDLLRPYLPTETKLARQLDKQSLRGFRTKRSPGDGV